MCGRFRLSKPVRAVADLFALPEAPEELKPRYNVSPTQAIPVARLADGKRELVTVRWGFIPRWMKDEKPKVRPFNARGDGVATNGMFRSSFKDRRCLIPADGFYEWPKTGPKVASLFGLRGGGVFAMAGLWDRRKDDVTATIVTTEANELLAALPHERMPVIVELPDFDRWLDPATPANKLLAMLKPYPATLMEAVPVGPLVNKPANEGPELALPRAA